MRQKALQTRVDAGIEKLAKEAAAREGEDVSSWLRRLVTRELRPHVPLVAAWTGAKGTRSDVQSVDAEPEFFLAPYRESQNGLDRDFVIYATADRRLTNAAHLKRAAEWREVELRRWVFLRGSPTPWTSTGQMALLDGRVLITLRRVQ